MLSSIAPAVRPKAVLDIVLTEEILRGIATAALYMGVKVMTTEEGQQAIADFWERLTDHLKENFQMFVAGAGLGYYVVYEWQKSRWEECASAIADWFTPERYQNNPNITFGKVQVASGSVNLNVAGSLYFTVPTIGESYQKIEYNVNDCNICMYFNTPRYIFDALVDGSHGSTSEMTMGPFLSIEPFDNDFDLRFVSRFSINSAPVYFESGGVYTNEAFRHVADYESHLVLNNIYSTHSVDIVYSYNFTHKTEDGIYGIFKNGEGRWGFTKDYGNTLYNNLSFDSYFDAFNYFFTLCGMPLDRSVPFNPTGDVPDVQIDTDTVAQRLQEVQDMPDDDVLPMVVPSTDAQYEELLQNPDRVVDISGSAVYNADIDMPTVNGNLWKTKFPFCLPFDIINLFTGFSAEAQAPSFHLLVMPANSFGLSNDDIYWDIDFSPYNNLVQILRFFIAIAFVLWLIVLTRKVIGS